MSHINGTRKISVDFPLELLDKVDETAKWMYMSRSEYIRLAVWHSTQVISSAEESTLQQWNRTKLSEYLKELVG
ncbi:MAG: ribbon-helix-helix domain-containing protein [Patescibacteria group bacterium]